MVELEDIKLLSNTSREGNILRLCDIRFRIGNVLFEGVGVAYQTLCVGYGSCPDDTKIIILKLNPVEGDESDGKGTLIRVAQRIADEITEYEAHI